jgi:hypothetical protein
MDLVQRLGLKALARLWSAACSARRRLGWLLIPAAGVGWLWAEPQLEVLVREDQAFRLTWAGIHLPPQPSWIAVDVKERALQRAGFPPEFSLLAPQLAERVARALVLEPWVRELSGVSCSRSKGVEVLLSYREPVALVQRESDLVAIDQDGVVLPLGELQSSSSYLRVLVGNLPSPGPPGARWEHPVVETAARLADFLKEYASQLNVAVIDLTLCGRDPTKSKGPIFLLTRAGSRVIWGAPGGDSSPGELSAEQKLKMLLDYARRFGDLDRPEGPYEIDVTQWTGLVRRRRDSLPWRPAEPVSPGPQTDLGRKTPSPHP